VTQAIGFVTMQAQRHGVALTQDIPPEAHEVMADKRAILQILINLLSNGVKYTQANGRVSVKARAVAGALEIAVSDTGVGISEADLLRLGQPFEQVESEYTRSKEGTGLGLALVRALTHLHGGTMAMEVDAGRGHLRPDHASQRGPRRQGERSSGDRNRKPEAENRLVFAFLRRFRFSMARLKSSIYVQALIRRCEVAGASAYLVRRGAEEAGAVLSQAQSPRRHLVRHEPCSPRRGARLDASSRGCRRRAPRFGLFCQAGPDRSGHLDRRNRGPRRPHFRG
jgi:hypothetical protein